MKPKPIVNFQRLLLLSLLLTVLNILVHYRTLRSTALANGASPAGPIVGALIAVAFYLLFRVGIGNLASNVAKWFFVAWTGFSLVAVSASLSKTMNIGLYYALLDCLSFLLQVAAATVLFHKDSKVWLQGRHLKAQND